MTDCSMMRMAVPIIAPENKVCLTLEEAAGVFGIGTKTLRKIVENNPYADFILTIGTRKLIKRKLFEKFVLDSVELAVGV